MPRVERPDMSAFPPCRQCVSYCALKQFVIGKDGKLVAVCAKSEHRMRDKAAKSALPS